MMVSVWQILYTKHALPDKGVITDLSGFVHIIALSQN